MTEAERANARAALRVRMFAAEPEGRLVGAAATMRLSQEERQAGRSSLQAFMRTKPMQEAPVARASVFASLLHFNVSRLALASSSAFVIAILATGGIAEAALPGDMLYPVKLYVTEPIREQIARTPAARRAWEVERLERRFAEHQRLTDSGRMTDERREELEFLIGMQASRIEAQLEQIPEESDDPQTEAFRTHLEQVLIQRQAAIESITQDRTAPPELVPVLRDARGRREQVEESAEQRVDRFERIRERLQRQRRRAVAPPPEEANVLDDAAELPQISQPLTDL
jgi:hypothetical protein